MAKFKYGVPILYKGRLPRRPTRTGLPEPPLCPSPSVSSSLSLTSPSWGPGRPPDEADHATALHFHQLALDNVKQSGDKELEGLAHENFGVRHCPAWLSVH